MAQILCLSCDEPQDQVEIHHAESEDDDDTFEIACDCGCTKGYEG